MLVGGALEAQARPLNVSARRDLAFGRILAGVPTTISPMTTQAGQFELRGQRNAEVQVVFVLPPALTLTSGEALPLVFAANDGVASATTNPATGTAFDPRTPLVQLLGGNGRLHIFLGSTAQPALTQRSGFYSGIVTMTAAYTGN